MGGLLPIVSWPSPNTIKHEVNVIIYCLLLHVNAFTLEFGHAQLCYVKLAYCNLDVLLFLLWTFLFCYFGYGHYK